MSHVCLKNLFLNRLLISIECQVDRWVRRQGASLRQCVVGSVRGAKGLKQCVLGGSLGLWECKKSETQPPPCMAWLGRTDQCVGF